MLKIKMRKTELLLLLLPAVLSPLLCISASVASVHSQSPCETNHLICELQEAKLKVAYLESILEDRIQEINARPIYLREKEKLNEELTHEFGHLQLALLNMKLQHNSLLVDERVHVLEDKVWLLRAASRKKKFELDTLEAKAEDALKRLEVVSSQVKMMVDIITEQWIQIQQLEQALQIAEMRTLKAKRQLSFSRCTFLKFVRSLVSCLLEKLMEILNMFFLYEESALRSLVTRSFHVSERAFSTAKHYHHQLQGLIRDQMESKEFTAVLANDELVFFVASALVTFPIIGALVFLLSRVTNRVG